MRAGLLCTYVDRHGRRCLRGWHASQLHTFKPLPRQSVKGAAKARRWARTSREVRAGRPVCDVEGCQAQATEVHHRIRRSQGGSDSPDNLIALCKEHHDFAHGNPEQARLYGLLGRGTDREAAS